MRQHAARHGVAGHDFKECFLSAVNVWLWALCVLIAGDWLLDQNGGAIQTDKTTATSPGRRSASAEFSPE
jgi:hypothetical protein